MAPVIVDGGDVRQEGQVCGGCVDATIVGAHVVAREESAQFLTCCYDVVSLVPFNGRVGGVGDVVAPLLLCAGVL